MNDSTPPPLTMADIDKAQAARPKQSAFKLAIMVTAITVVGFLIFLGAWILVTTSGASGNRATDIGTVQSQLEPSTTSQPPQEQATEPPARTPATPVEFEGKGDKIIELGSSAFAATIRNTGGSSNFAVWALDDSLTERDLLVNTIGDYVGTVLAVEDSYGGLKIKSDGAWTISVIPAVDVPVATGPVLGRGDDVFWWEGPGRTPAVIQHDGADNFAVWLYSSEGSDLLVNEIGNYQGEQIIYTGIMRVQADGAWSITPR